MDIAGGSGNFLQSILTMDKDINGVLIELPAVARYAETKFKGDLKNRIKFIKGSFREVEFPETQCTIISNILHDWLEDDCVVLLQNAYNALAPGGTLIINEKMLAEGDDETNRIVHQMSIDMLYWTDGIQYHRDELVEFCKRVGFKGFRFQKMPSLCTVLIT